LGLMIRTGTAEKLYRFDLDFTKVSAIAIRNETAPGKFPKRREVTHTSTRDDGWVWIDLRPSKVKKPAVAAP